MAENAPQSFANGVIDEGDRLVLHENGAEAFADYRADSGRMIVPHVEAAHSLRGTGAAGRLMEGLVDAARQRGLKIVPLCPYADSWMRRHPETADLRA
jgi:predicted GNAT family acetyltransferase